MADSPARSVFSNPASSTPAEISRYVQALLDLLGDQSPIAVLRRTSPAIALFVEGVPAGW